jgi:hypothetical protein
MSSNPPTERLRIMFSKIATRSFTHGFSGNDQADSGGIPERRPLGRRIEHVKAEGTQVMVASRRRWPGSTRTSGWSLVLHPQKYATARNCGRHPASSRRQEAPAAEVTATLAEPLPQQGRTEYEADVLRHVAGGNRNRGVAEKLFIADETV